MEQLANNIQNQADNAAEWATLEVKHTPAEVNAMNVLNGVVDSLGNNQTNAQLTSVIGMVSTLIRDGHIDQLDQALQRVFPDYYHDIQADNLEARF